MIINVSEIQDWIAQDPEPQMQKELKTLLEAAQAGNTVAEADLADRFQGPLQFGTAGLRGKMGAGPFRMNRATVRKAAYGLTTWLLAHTDTPLVVVGYDARYNSYDFAVDTVAIVTAAGGKALLMPRTLPTPMLAFAVRHLGADAGVMVTASHNPAQDNGYKVYLGGQVVSAEGNGVQIIPPVDSEIAKEIAAAPPANEIPLAENGWEIINETVIDTYIHNTVGKNIAERDLQIVYTPMHGVGKETMERILSSAGFRNVEVVAEQGEPDPDFPTVTFPNPEEKGALDLSIKLAKKLNADIVIASDPDADRCSAAIPSATGSWRQLSGDEIGTLLGEYVAARAQLGTLACSIVSSRQLVKIAAYHGLQHEFTLTGFKWIARANNIVYGYEEAIGFCVDPTLVKDKDGISAGLLLATLAAELKVAGKTIENELDRLALRDDIYLSAPVTIRVDDLRLIPATMQFMRENPPTEIAGIKVTSVIDMNKTGQALPPTDGIMIHTELNDRIIIRPSGTEPKVKCYLEVIEPVLDENALVMAKQNAQLRLDKLAQDMHALLTSV